MVCNTSLVTDVQPQIQGAMRLHSALTIRAKLQEISAPFWAVALLGPSIEVKEGQ
jgi:hypothetical protein